MGVGLAARATARVGGNTPGLPCIVQAPTPHPAPAGRRGAEQPGLCGLARPGLACWPGIRTQQPAAPEASPGAGDSPHQGTSRWALWGRALATLHGSAAPTSSNQARPLLLPPIHGFSAGGCSGWNGSCLVLVKSMRSCAATLTCRFKCYNPCPERTARAEDLPLCVRLVRPTWACRVC